MKELGEIRSRVLGEEDFLDKQVKGEDYLGGFLDIGIYDQLNSRLNLSHIYPHDTMNFYVATLVVRAWDTVRANRVESEERIEDDRLKYRATEVSYKDRASVIGGIEMEEGDKFIYLQFPKVIIDPHKVESGMPDKDEIKRFLGETVKNVMKDSSTELGRFGFGKDAKMVVIDVGQPRRQNTEADRLPEREDFRQGLEEYFRSELGDYLPNSERTTFEELMGRRLLVGRDLPLIALSKEEFDISRLTPNEIFLKACMQSGDLRIINEYLPAMKVAITEDEKERAIREFKRHISQKFSTTLEDKFGGSEVRNVGGAKKYGYDRQRLSKNVILNSRSNKSLTHRFISSQESVIDVDLKEVDSLLGLSGVDFQEVLDGRPTNINVQYVLYQMLRNYSYDELFSKSEDYVDDFIEELDKNGISLEYPDDAYNCMIDSWRTMKRRVINPVTHISPLLRTVALFLLLQSSRNYIDPLANNLFSHLGSNDSKSSDSPDPIALSTVGFGVEKGKGEIEWKVSSTGIDTAGYYTIGTSSEMINRQWVGTEGTGPVNYSADIEGNISDNGSEIILERIQPLPGSGEAFLPIPIKDGTVLGAVRVIDRKGEAVAHVVYLNTDGTAALYIPPVTEGSFVKITVVLDESDVEQVHSTGSNYQYIDMGELNNEALSSYFDAFTGVDVTNFDENTADEIEDNIAAEVASRHKYSVDPKYNKYLEGLDTPDEVVNAIADLGFCDCDVCNTEVVLLTSLLPNTEVSMATGYLLGADNVASGEGEYLTSLSLHGYGVDEKGRIIDGTPGNIADDAATEKYLSNLNNTNTYGDQWNKMEKQFSNVSTTEKADKYKDDFVHLLEEYRLALGLIALGTSGVILAKPTFRAYKKLEDKKIAYRIIERAVTRSMTIDELKYMDSFFTNISYNVDADQTKGSELERLYEEKEGVKYDRKSLFNKLRNETDKSRLREYLLDPDKYDEKLRITPIQKAKIRIMAKMLINHRYYQ